MKDEVKLPKKAYCINLKDREDRWKLIQRNWSDKIEVVRVDAIDKRSTKEGMLGVYMSHLKIMMEYMETEDFDNGYPLLILEDDSVPCLDFKNRLQKFWPLLPKDWQIFLPGFWPNQFSSFEKVNEYIHKAKLEVIGNHCWCIHPDHIPEVASFFKHYHNRHLDDVMRAIQLRMNMYIAIPSFAHQDGVWSDTSSQPAYTDPTRLYFKNVL